MRKKKRMTQQYQKIVMPNAECSELTNAQADDPTRSVPEFMTLEAQRHMRVFVN